LRRLEIKLEVAATKEERNKLLDGRRHAAAGGDKRASAVDEDRRSSPAQWPRAGTSVYSKRAGRDRTLQLVPRPNTLEPPSVGLSNFALTLVQGMSQITEATSQSPYPQPQARSPSDDEDLSEPSVGK